MPASPYNFATTATNYIKLKGGNILETPIDWPGGEQIWIGQMQQWSTVFPGWIQPQILNWKARGANIVRFFGSAEGVMLGYFSQSYYETNVAELIAFCRAQGMMLGMCGNGVASYSEYNLTDAQWRSDGWASIESLINNVLIPNQDVVAYIEPGMQETPTDADSLALSLYFASQTKAITTIPVLLSNPNSTANFPAFAASPSCDAISFHYYPSNYDPQDEMNDIALVFASCGSKPVYIEETGATHYVDYPSWEAHIGSVFGAAFYHPDCAGCELWACPAPVIDGTFTIYGPVAAAPDYNSIWPDTIASLKYASYSPRSRNLSFNVTAASGNMNGTIPLVLTTGEIADPTESLSILQSHFRIAYPAFLSGTIDVTGTGSISLVATVAGAATTIGSATVSGAGAKFAIAGTAPSGAVSLTIAASGGGAFANLSGAISVGSAPPIVISKAAPLMRPRLAPSLNRALITPLR